MSASAVADEYDGYDTAMLQDEIGLDREMTARSFREYVELAWPLVEPSQPFVGGWHIDAMCDVLEACKRQEILRLIMNVPPGVGKSMIGSVLFPTWVWTDWAGAKLITASHGEDLAKSFALRSRGLMESLWWRSRWGHQMTPKKAVWSATDYRNMQGGMRYSVGASTGVVGQHGHIQIGDDPHKPQDIVGVAALSKGNLEKSKTWWSESMATRVVDRATAVRILIMQRLHELDLCGIELEAGGYHHLCLPMEYVPKFCSLPTPAEPDNRPCPIKKCKATHDVKADPRTELSELLDPVRSPRNAVNAQKRELGARGTAGQMEQSPSPAEGLIFKRSQIRHYRRAELPRRFGKMVQSWDMTFKEAGSSFVVGQVWGQLHADCYLLAQVRDRWGLTGTIEQVKLLTLRFPKAHKKLVEAKANGHAVVDSLRKKISGLVLVEPDGGKEARANAVEPDFDSGNVWLPHPDEEPWIEEYVEELLAFPAGKHDDQVDTTTQALHYLRRGNLNRLRAAMANA